MTQTATRTFKTGDQEDKNFVCSICLEMCNTPKYLPCLHAFCKLCISSYIQSFVAKDKTCNGFKCPVCQSFVSFEENSTSPECWADKLPNYQFKNQCNVCELSNIYQRAVSWCTVCKEAMCSACENCHRKFKMTACHKLLVFREVQTNKTTALTGKIPCDDHANQFVEMYCKDHRKPCCTVCANVKHRECKQFVEIEDAATGIKESKQMAGFLELMIQWKKLIEKSIENTEENVSTVEIMEINIFSDIEKMMHDIIEHLHTLEKAAKYEIAVTKNEIVTQLTDKLTEMSRLKSTVDKWHRTLSICITEGSDIECLVEINKLILMKEKIESEIKNATSNTDKKSFRFKRNHVVENFKENVTSLGKISILNAKQKAQSEALRASSINFVSNMGKGSFGFERNHEISEVDIVNPKPSIKLQSIYAASINSVPKQEVSHFRTGKLKTLFTFSTGDTSLSEVSGIFTENFIFISTFKMRKLSKLSMNGVFQSDIEFPTGPYDIENIPENQLAVSFQSLKEIKFINLHTMSILRTIKVPVLVYGLRYIDVSNQFVFACGGSIVSLNAKNGKGIEETKTSGDTWLLCANGSKSYVYADGWKSVSCSADGTKQFTYTNQLLDRPRGIDADFHGNLYVCSLSTNSIHQLSPSGELIRTISCDDLETVDPWVIRFKQNSNTFLVTSVSSGKVVVAEIC
ncbi:unnamed protein product [Mytilus coruscus]|uniref:TRIM56 n=1 Tax=Mytilus coruscus TaxID=42192 RepID=A0A6J8A010_MYTCO|nr:unnamed protein product [Mytilus coruscus]